MQCRLKSTNDFREKVIMKMIFLLKSRMVTVYRNINTVKFVKMFLTLFFYETKYPCKDTKQNIK
jgi:hypothetical protein